MDRIREVLEMYEHLFQELADDDGCPLPCMDLSIDYIDEADYYGCDFRETQKTIMLFFTGSSDYFPGIWIGNDSLELIDQMPIYIFDLSCNTHTFESNCNFKQYITKLLEYYININTSTRQNLDDAMTLLNNLNIFSDNMIDKGTYRLTIADPV